MLCWVLLNFQNTYRHSHGSSITEAFVIMSCAHQIAKGTLQFEKDEKAAEPVSLARYGYAGEIFWVVYCSFPGLQIGQLRNRWISRFHQGQLSFSDSYLYRSHAGSDNFFRNSGSLIPMLQPLMCACWESLGQNEGHRLSREDQWSASLGYSDGEVNSSRL